MQDAHWNVTGITNSSASVQERYAYSSYGAAAFLSNAFMGQSTSNFDWRDLFTGRRLDLETGLYFFRARYLVTAVGQFTSRDPIEYVGSMNLLEILGSSPLVRLDPSGLLQEPCDKVTCDKCVKDAIKNDPVMKELEKLGGLGSGLPGYSKGCKPDVTCEKCNFFEGGSYDPTTHTIRIMPII